MDGTKEQTNEPSRLADWTATHRGLGNPRASDVHVYYLPSNPVQTRYARELWERIRRECKPVPLLFLGRHVLSRLGMG